MNRYFATMSIALCIGTGYADEQREGYVLKSDQGEVTWAGTRIKASSETGTRGIEVVVVEGIEVVVVVEGIDVVVVVDGEYSHQSSISQAGQGF